MNNSAHIVKKEAPALKIVSRSEDVIPMENQKIFRALMFSLSRMSRHVEVCHLPLKEWSSIQNDPKNWMH